MTVPADMTPDRLREGARLLRREGYVHQADTFDRWADELEAATPVIDAAHLARQRDWSAATFGPGARTKGVIDHIRKELAEIEAEPDDVFEWIDVVILAFDGALRAGHEPQAVIDAMKAKQATNEARSWPDWRIMSEDEAIEHDRQPAPLTAEGGFTDWTRSTETIRSWVNGGGVSIERLADELRFWLAWAEASTAGRTAGSAPKEACDQSTASEEGGLGVGTAVPQPTPDPAAPFPVGARVEVAGWIDPAGTVVPPPTDARWVRPDGRSTTHVIRTNLLRAVPTLPVPADVVARLLATGQVSDDDRAALARAGEGE